MFGIGPQETFVILLLILLLFGANRIPEVARSIGKGLREFQKAASEFQRAIEAGEPAPKRPRDGAPPMPAASHVPPPPPLAGDPRTLPPGPRAPQPGRDAGGPSSAVPPAGSA